MDLKDTAVVVTGGASGLGGATSRLFAEQGAKVSILDRDGDKGAAMARDIGGRSYPIDVTDAEAVGNALDDAVGHHGTARILVNCAGIAIAVKTVSRGEPHDLDLFKKVISVNLIGSFNCIRLFAARLTKADPIGEERGVIINTASVAAFDGQIGQAAYSASKGGIAGMTLPIARDLADKLIRCTTIAPGLFLTPLLMGLPEEAQKSLGRSVPHPARLGDPSEYAMLAQQIVRNPMLNGETIRLDGALRMAPR